MCGFGFKPESKQILRDTYEEKSIKHEKARIRNTDMGSTGTEQTQTDRQTDTHTHTQTYTLIAP